MSISSASELELSLISFAGSDSTLTWQGWGKQKRRRQEGWGWVGAASIQRKQLIEGRLLFKQIWYTPLGNFGLKINTMCRLKHMFVF